MSFEPFNTLFVRPTISEDPIVCRSLAQLNLARTNHPKSPLVLTCDSLIPDLGLIEVAQNLKADIAISRIESLASYAQLNLKSLEYIYWPDPRLQDTSLLSPKVSIKKSATNKEVTFSVIIPHFENKERLLSSLSHWLSQERGDFEVIIVDDGSRPERCVNLDEIANDDRVSLVYLSRDKKRQRGDSHFRAALARNSGVSLARGKYLVFSDSDIAPPTSFLSQLSSDFASADILMPYRWQLAPHSSAYFTKEFSLDSDVILERGAHWENFQLQAIHNGRRDISWPWVSTYCLAVTKSTFDQLGGFCPTFLTYGFEDTEFGYRAYKAKKNIKFTEQNVFHLYQDKTHSEYQNSPQNKKQLLKKSAITFLANHPNIEVYSEMRKWL